MALEFLSFLSTFNKSAKFIKISVDSGGQSRIAHLIGFW